MHSKICEYCRKSFLNKNQVFCSRECQIAHSKLKECKGCGELNVKHDDLNENFCSEKCERKIAKYLFRCNLETSLGLGFLSKKRLIKIEYLLQDDETGLIESNILEFD